MPPIPLNVTLLRSGILMSASLAKSFGAVKRMANNRRPNTDAYFSP